MESPPALGSTLPFAGSCPSEGLWSVSKGGWKIQPSARRSDDDKGCSDGFTRGGDSAPSSTLRQQVGIRETLFARGRPAYAAQRLGSTVGVANADRVAGGARKHRPRSNEGPRGMKRRRSCSVGPSAPSVLPWLAAHAVLLRQGEVACPRGRREGEQFVASSDAASDARESDARECVRASYAVAEVVERHQGPESRRFVVSRENAGFRAGEDGGLVGSNQSGNAVSWGCR